MALVPIEQLGGVGIIRDVPPYSIEPNAWSDGVNVRFTDKGVQNIEGYRQVMDKCPIEVQHIVFYGITDDPDYWVAFGSGQIWCWCETHEPDDTNGRWISTTLLGVQLIATNGIDPILIWELDENGSVSASQKFIELDLDLSTSVSEHEHGITVGSEGMVGPYPQTINAFKSILIGMNYPKGPTRVWWSSPNGHYSTSTWDYYNKDQDAGDYELNDTRGAIIDGAPLGEAFIIYKEDSIYIASYVGRPFIFGFKTLSKDTGLLTKNALQAYPGGHIFMSRSDVHITNGQDVMSLLSDKMQGEIFNNINGDYYHNAFISADRANNEAYICWPSAFSEYCDKCVIWNWATGALSMRDVPDVSDIKEGVVRGELGIDSWDSYEPPTPKPTTWHTIGVDRRWGSTAFEAVHPELVFTSPVDKLIRRSGGGIHTIDGGAMVAYVERTGMDLGDPGSVKKVNAIWPKITTTGSEIVQISVCGQMSPDADIRWEGPYDFDPDKQSKISCRVTGKYFGWKVESEGFLKWQCHGVEFNVEQGGQRGSRVQ